MATHRITDGTTTVNLIYHSATNPGYSLHTYAPAIAVWQGSAGYADVVEERTIDIFGSTASEAIGRLAVLSKLLRQADRWGRGVPVNPVRVEYQPRGAAQLYQALIVGLPDPEASESMLRIDPTFDRDLGAYVIRNVRITTRQRGGWHGAAESASESGVARLNEVHQLVFATSHPYDSPVTLQITMPPSATGSVQPGVMLWTDQDSTRGIAVRPARDSANGTFTSVIDPTAGTNASGNILQFTPSTTNAQQSGDILPLAAPGIAAIYVLVRTNGVACTWTITPLVRYASNQYQRGRATQIDGAQTSVPAVLNLGTLTLLSNANDRLRFEVQPSTTSGTPTIWFDTIVLLNTGLGNAGALQVNPGWWTTDALLPVTIDSLTLADRTLDAPRPSISATKGTDAVPFPAFGPMPLVSGPDIYSPVQSGRIRYVWLQPGSGSSPSFTPKWRISGAVFDSAATKRLAYLTPE